MSDPNPVVPRSAVGEVLQATRSRSTSSAAPPPRPIRFVAAAPQVPAPPPRSAPLLAQTRTRRQLPVVPVVPTTAPKVVHAPSGRRMEVRRAADGSVTFSAPPPKTKEITFSGGGGKGAALPGAVRALENGNVLKDVESLTGASVGSMTAALLAAGMTADEFAVIGNADSTAEKVLEGKSMKAALVGGIAKSTIGIGSRLTGEGLESLVGDAVSQTLCKRIREYEVKQLNAGQPFADDLKAVYERLVAAKPGDGATFVDVATVAKHIPQVKMLMVNASLIGIVDKKGGKLEKKPKPQIVTFSAKNNGHVRIAEAVRASAALPPVFEPVDIQLESGLWGRFQDGGVLNNAPTSESIGAARDLDPVPEQGGMTFIFEEEASKEVMDGAAVPRGNGVNDFFAKAKNSAADYGKNRLLADRPEDVVMVPLTYEVTNKKGKVEKKDFSTFGDGTINFSMSAEEKLKLQALTEAATNAHVKQKLEPKSRKFASVDQMLNCLPMSDLEALAADGYEGAAETLRFRERVLTLIDGIIASTKALSSLSAARMLEQPAVRDAFGELEQLSSGNKERQALVARELNRSGKIDPLLDALRKDDSTGSAMLEQAYAVNDGCRARDHAKLILQDVIYPFMVSVDPKSSGGEVLSIVDALLRKVSAPADVNQALRMAIDHFGKKKDRLGRKGYKKFAQELTGRLLKDG